MDDKFNGEDRRHQSYVTHDELNECRVEVTETLQRLDDKFTKHSDSFSEMRVAITSISISFDQQTTLIAKITKSLGEHDDRIDKVNEKVEKNTTDDLLWRTKVTYTSIGAIGVIGVLWTVAKNFIG